MARLGVVEIVMAKNVAGAAWSSPVRYCKPGIGRAGTETIWQAECQALNEVMQV